MAVVDLHYLNTVENIFTYGGRTGHEIVMVYDGAFVDRSLYKQVIIQGVEDDGLPFRAVWVVDQVERLRRFGRAASQSDVVGGIACHSTFKLSEWIDRR